MAVVAVVCSFLASSAAGAPKPPGELVLTFGRSIMQEQFPLCTTNNVDTESLPTIAANLQAMGYSANGSVVAGFIGASDQCEHFTELYPSWSDLESLQTTYGWTFFSASDDHTDLTQIQDPQQLAADTCGTIATLSANGIVHPEAQFNYPGGRADASTQSVVSQCFDFARTYGVKNDYTSRKVANTDWLIKVFSINGGTTNYTSEATLVTEMSPVAGSVAQVQAYALVDGDYGAVGTGSWWRCGDGEQHQTSRTELYCASDFYGALSQIPQGTVTTNPYAVSQLWGRQVPGN